MKKVYYSIVAIGVIVFTYWLFKSLPSFSTKLIAVTTDTINSTSFSSSGSFRFKSTPERTDLLQQMVYINTEFIKNSPNKIKEPKYLKKFYKLEKFFPNFKNYYAAKLKVQNAIYTELPLLYSSTASLSELELRTYFDSNTSYLEKKWGINDFTEFTNIVSTIKQTNGNKVISCELEDSYFYIPEQNILSYRIILTLENKTNIYLAVNVHIYDFSDHQSVPLVRFLGTEGGTSYV